MDCRSPRLLLGQSWRKSKEMGETRLNAIRKQGNSLVSYLNKVYLQEGQTIMRIKFYQNTFGKEVAVTHFT